MMEVTRLPPVRNPHVVFLCDYVQVPDGEGEVVSVNPESVSVRLYDQWGRPTETVLAYMREHVVHHPHGRNPAAWR